MNFITFDYTKSADKVSSRAFYPISVPNTMYEGIDVSALSDELQALFVAKMEDAKLRFLNECLAIKADFDVVNDYRRFDPNKMSNIKTECL